MRQQHYPFQGSGDFTEEGIERILRVRGKWYTTLTSGPDMLFALSNSQIVIAHARLETQAYFHK